MPDNFRVAHDHRAVEVIVLAAFRRTVLNARIEDAVDLFLQEVFNMPVNELGRIAGRIGRNCVDSFSVQLFRRLVRQNYAITETGKKVNQKG